MSTPTASSYSDRNWWESDRKKFPTAVGAFYPRIWSENFDFWSINQLNVQRRNSTINSGDFTWLRSKLIRFRSENFFGGDRRLRPSQIRSEKFDLPPGEHPWYPSPIYCRYWHYRTTRLLSTVDTSIIKTTRQHVDTSTTFTFIMLSR